VDVEEGSKMNHGSMWMASRRDYALMFVGAASFIAEIGWCGTHHNWAGLYWLMYLGWAVLALALLIMSLSPLTFVLSGALGDKKRGMNTVRFVDRGIYAVVRHPIYIGWIMIVTSFVLVSQHWPAALLAILPVAMFIAAIQIEDRSNVEKFGEDYIRYQRRVPKANLFLGIIRLINRKP